ncbi:hypothetical protein FEM48_Zijuj04G0098500 [Ziziphus jujuba var. spinosa]|uniref:C2H2-type domain-containing protein n=1 Tax=Ziziphus jujuba var. spinosa TaxID=714518 RepID=A0A978VJ68_ZIZJJ|nr:hypothetical protein FEM48_Zijuj04G0098500 [Ziziphus jujuba var. spinosa]
MAEEAISSGFVQNPISGGSDNPPAVKKKRNLPGTPGKLLLDSLPFPKLILSIYPEAEVIALSPKTLMATNRFLCEICGKGFQRDQNLQLHRRGHNLPWKLKQRTSKEPRKRVYVCPEKSCVHNHPSRALGDLTGIKKHFCRKHGEKKWKCEKCSKRRDSFITHRAFCDALAEETARLNAASNISNSMAAGNINYHFIGTSLAPTMATQPFPSVFKPISSNAETIIRQTTRGLSVWMGQGSQGHEPLAANNTTLQDQIHQFGPAVSSVGTLFGDPLVSCSNPPAPSDYQLNWVFGSKISSNNAHEDQLTSSTTSLPLSDVKGGGTQLINVPSLYSTQHHSHQTPSANMSATALLQKAAQIGATSTDSSFLGSFGLKCSNNNGGQVQEGNKFCGLYCSNAMSRSHGSSVENPEADVPQMYPAAKRRHVQSSEEGAGRGGQTRDFLGVGVQTICHPSSINGWI